MADSSLKDFYTTEQIAELPYIISLYMKRIEKAIASYTEASGKSPNVIVLPEMRQRPDYVYTVYGCEVLFDPGSKKVRAGTLIALDK